MGDWGRAKSLPSPQSPTCPIPAAHLSAHGDREPHLVIPSRRQLPQPQRHPSTSRIRAHLHPHRLIPNQPRQPRDDLLPGERPSPDLLPAEPAIVGVVEVTQNAGHGRGSVGKSVQDVLIGASGIDHGILRDQPVQQDPCLFLGGGNHARTAQHRPENSCTAPFDLPQVSTFRTRSCTPHPTASTPRPAGRTSARSIAALVLTVAISRMSARAHPSADTIFLVSASSVLVRATNSHRSVTIFTMRAPVLASARLLGGVIPVLFHACLESSTVEHLLAPAGPHRFDADWDDDAGWPFNVAVRSLRRRFRCTPRPPIPP